MTLVEQLPTFTTSATLKQYREAYDAVQCVCFKQVDGINSRRKGFRSNTCSNNKKRKRTRTRKHKKLKSLLPDESSATALSFQRDILNTFQAATIRDQESWTVENDAGDASSSTLTSAADFLSPSSTQNGYCSFVLQGLGDDSNQALSNFTNRHVQHPSLPLIARNDAQQQQIKDTVCIAEPYWLFVGRNNNTSENMQGRNEHTDDIEHNGGTFHYQLAGTKIWTIRPSEELRAQCEELDIALKESYRHTVEEGDLFVINTRLWWHQTEIPGTRTTSRDADHDDDDNSTRNNSEMVCSGRSNLSISYARDLYLDGTQPNLGTNSRTMRMYSKDGSWATAFIPKGTVLLTEADPPISKTSKRAHANCKMIIVQDKDDEGGEEQLALVTLKDIQEGEFYIILENINETMVEREMD